MRTASSILAVCCCLSSSAASSLKPSFDLKDVVRQVRSASSGSSAVGREPLPDSGEFLIDTNVTGAPPSGNQSEPAVAFGGANFLVAWQDDRSGSHIYGALVTPQGLVLDRVGIAISTTAGEQYVPAVAFDGENYLVVWEDSRNGSHDIYGARVTPQGTVLDTAGIALSLAAGDQRWPTIGFDGTDFLAVWSDYRNGSNCDVYGARVTPQGTVLDTAGIPISLATNDQCGPVVGFDGVNSLVVELV